MMLRASLFTAVLALAACGSPSRIYESAPIDSGTDTTTPDTTADTPTTPGELGAPCTNNEQCASKFCLDIGRCSKACPTAGVCPNSSNWKCLVVPTRGPMCECDVLSMTDVPCNGIDDNCDGKIDEDSPTCGGKCVDTRTDSLHCGGCDKPCDGGSACKDSKCECPSDKPNLCAMKCVDTKADTANCGGCDMPCATGETCVDSMCKKASVVDVMILLDVTGSNQAQLNAIIPNLNAKLVAPLFKIADVQVGVLYMSEFAFAMYGSAPDQLFKGASEPTAMESTIPPLLTMYPKMMGGDAPDAMVEALGTLAGLPIHPLSTALTCSMGRTAGGCWRPMSKKVVVLVTDDIFHNGPDPMTPTALYMPYVGIVPAPQEWPSVLKAMATQKITLLIMNSSSFAAPGLKQWELMLKDLGQPATDIYPSATAADSITASDAVVKRVTAIKGP